MASAEKLHQASRLAEDVLSGLFEAHRTAQRCRASSDSKHKDDWARAFAASICEIEAAAVALYDLLRGDVELAFASVTSSPVDIGAPHSSVLPSIHTAIAVQGTDIRDYVAYAIAKAFAVAKASCLQGDSSPGQNRMLAHIDVAVDCFLECAWSVADANKAGALRVQELARALEKASPPRDGNEVYPAGNRRKRNRPPITARPLTAKQVQVAQVVGECNGNLSAAARRLGIDRKTVKQHYDAATGKLGRKTVKHATQPHRTDLRGQADLSADDDRRR